MKIYEELSTCVRIFELEDDFENFPYEIKGGEIMTENQQ